MADGAMVGIVIKLVFFAGKVPGQHLKNNLS